ncbi:MAG: hypothetical protein HYU64_11905 [Armatimonadetes bacterium]|nr:hypothetical protein [Armatimonadota bacterium]
MLRIAWIAEENAPEVKEAALLLGRCPARAVASEQSGRILRKYDVPFRMLPPTKQPADTEARWLRLSNRTKFDLWIILLKPCEQLFLPHFSELSSLNVARHASEISLIRSLAYDRKESAVVVHSRQLEPVLSELAKTGALSTPTRRELLESALLLVSDYDRKLAQAVHGESGHSGPPIKVSPPFLKSSYAEIEKFRGPDLSGMQSVDLELALQYIREFAGPAAVLIRNYQSCGLAEAPTLKEAFQKALAAGRPSAGTLALNRPVTGDLARLLAACAFHVIVAPTYDAEALFRLCQNESTTLLTMKRGSSPAPEPSHLTSLASRVHVKEKDLLTLSGNRFRVVSHRQPSPADWYDLLYTWKVLKQLPVRAIVVARHKELLGVGAGHASSLSDVRVAVEQASQRAQGAVMASDTFLPFRGGVELAGQFGIRAVIEPGGSIRDREVIESADRYNMVMIFTGTGL